MTRMIPNSCSPNTSSSAEKRMFEIIKQAKGTERWVCLHSLNLAHHARKRSAEIDFLLITEHGVFVLEVKGGRVGRQHGAWYTVTGRDLTKDIESPFVQARDAMFALDRRLKEASREEKISKSLSQLMIGYGVITPDVPLREKISSKTGGEDPDFVYDSTDARLPFVKFVERLTRVNREIQKGKRHAPKEAETREFIDFLRGDFDLVVPLAVINQQITEQLVRLEKEQYNVLDGIRARERAIVEGPAGSGKTLLAVESARRSAAEGRTILLVVFNKLLGAALRQIFHHEGLSEKITVRHSSALLREAIKEAGMYDEFQAECEGAEVSRILFELEPEFGALALMETSAAAYDELIVDEAQDLMLHEMLDAFNAVLKGGIEGGRWLFMLDSNNQAGVYGRFDSEALKRIGEHGSSIFLPVNRRNTRQIAEEVKTLTSPKQFSEAVVDGLPVKYIYYSKEKDKWKKILNQYQKLTDSEGVLPAQITLLVGTEKKQMEEQDNPLVERFKPLDEALVSAMVLGELEVSTWATVSGFKGLENDIIFLTNLSSLDGDWWMAVNYVGMMRARARLYIFIDQKLEKIVNQKFADSLPALGERDA